MKHRDTTKSVLIQTGLYATTIYEMEVWTGKDLHYTDEEYIAQLAEKGMMDCGLRKEMVGLYSSYKEALDYLEMMYDDSFEPFMEYAFIREKAMCCLMKPTDYLKEWTYECGLLEDESLVRNFAERENPFSGRPKEMVRFERGDIVMIPDGNSGYWGMVVNTPTIPADVSDGQDWRDDSYEIITGGSGAKFRRRVPAHRVLSPTCVPGFVRKILQDSATHFHFESFCL